MVLSVGGGWLTAKTADPRQVRHVTGAAAPSLLLGGVREGSRSWPTSHPCHTPPSRLVTSAVGVAVG